MPRHETVFVLDFGSQFNQLIARRVRELGVYCEIVPGDRSAASLRSRDPKALIFSGGPASVYDSQAPRFDPRLLDLGVPILGICYGLQAMIHQLGGGVHPADKREYGKAFVDLSRPEHPLVRGLPPRAWTVWMSHGDQVERLPDGFAALGSSPTCPHAVVADDVRRFYGLQFHPEVTHTDNGIQLISNFLRDIVGLRGDWTGESFVEESVARWRRELPQGNVILGLSGGVDSSVAAVLLHRALGDRLIGLFVDNGLLRKSEAREVIETFGNHFGFRLIAVDASDRFLSELAGVVDPEQKRKTIGRVFVEVFEREAARLPDVRWLAQGTIYPDVIESTSAKGGPSATIKSHHNVGGLPDRMKLKVVEPLRELFKDEVRQVGGLLGIPHALLHRHPFPGPGLAVRILGEVTRPRADRLREADAIFIEELHRAGIYGDIGQAFAVLLPVKSVGVMGDGRTYENVAALRAVCTTDFMTAEAAAIDHVLLHRIATRIVNEVRGINRVVYDITSKPPATIEWE